MTLLKKTLENNHIDTPEGINILDNLQYENALNNFQTCYKEFLSVNEDCKNVLEKHDLINDNLQNESALKNVLMDLELLTTESAIPPKELAAKALKELKVMIKNIVAKFIELFGRLKQFLYKFFEGNKMLQKKLEFQINKLGEAKKVYSLDHEEFNHHLPMIKDFGNTTEIDNMLKALLDSASALKSYGTQASLFKNSHFDANKEHLLECSKNRISYLISTDSSQLKIKTVDARFKDGELKSRLLTKDHLKHILERVMTFNGIADKYVADFEFLSKQLEKVDIKGDVNEHPHLVNNVRVSLEANGKFSNNIIHVTKGVFFVIASNIKCYENK